MKRQKLFTNFKGNVYKQRITNKASKSDETTTELTYERIVVRILTNNKWIHFI